MFSEIWATKKGLPLRRPFQPVIVRPAVSLRCIASAPAQAEIPPRKEEAKVEQAK